MKIETLEKKDFEANPIITYGIFETQFGHTLIAIYQEKVIHLSFSLNNSDEIKEYFFTKFENAVINKNNAIVKPYMDRLFNDEKVTVLLIGTPFQISVWKELLKIPFGQISTYATIAQNIGNTKAVRAVGTAIGANPIVYFIPCHRVISKDGSLGGFRWGLKLKQQMLQLEKN